MQFWDKFIVKNNFKDAWNTPSFLPLYIKQSRTSVTSAEISRNQSYHVPYSSKQQLGPIKHSESFKIQQSMIHISIFSCYKSLLSRIRRWYAAGHLAKKAHRGGGVSAGERKSTLIDAQGTEQRATATDCTLIHPRQHWLFDSFLSLTFPVENSNVWL